MGCTFDPNAHRLVRVKVPEKYNRVSVVETLAEPLQLLSGTMPFSDVTRHWPVSIAHQNILVSRIVSRCVYLRRIEIIYSHFWYSHKSNGSI